jgi:FkbM family methyltransferase
MTDEKFVFLLPARGFWTFLRTRQRRIALEKLMNRLLDVTRVRQLGSGMRHLAVYAFDGNSHAINIYGSPEREFMDLVFEFLNREGLVRGVAIDVGANLGMHSIRFAKFFDTVVAIEPHPITFELLRLNLRNYAPNSSVLNLAAGDSNGDALLYETKMQSMGAPSLLTPVESFGEHEIEVRKLDELSDRWHGRVGLLKVDTEGYELEVFKGASETIRNDKPVILFEDWNSKCGSASQAVQFLKSIGYSRFLVPEVYPGVKRTRLARLIHIVFYGVSIGLRRCDFMSKRGYDLIVALPDREPPIE